MRALLVRTNGKCRRSHTHPDKRENPVTPMDTKQLVAQWLVEHHAAMLSLADRFADAVHGSEDIVSQARVVALQRHAQATGVKSPLGWLLVITRSVGLQIARKRNRRAELRRAGPWEGSGLLKSSDEAVAQDWQAARLADERREQVLDIAHCLAPALRQLVHHALLDDSDDYRIANQCGISIAAVRQRRKRTINAIREALRSPAPPEDVDT